MYIQCKFLYIFAFVDSLVDNKKNENRVRWLQAGGTITNNAGTATDGLDVSKSEDYY